MSMCRTRRAEQGFTLIEIMIVVLIIGVLLAIAIPNFMNARQTSQKRTCLSNMRQIVRAKEEWAMRGNVGTPVWADLIGPAAYIKGDPSDPPLCPTNAVTYIINEVNTDPACPNAALGHTF